LEDISAGALGYSKSLDVDIPLLPIIKGEGIGVIAIN
jgi:hypothetical protein